MAKQKVLLQDNGNDLYPLATFNGLDLDNVIASTTNEYTAQEDCYVDYSCYSYVYAAIDGQRISAIFAVTPTGFDDAEGITPLKKGQTIKVTGYSGTKSIKVYGIKR